MENQLQAQQNIILDPDASDAAKDAAHQSIEHSIAVGRASNILSPHAAEQLSNKYIYGTIRSEAEWRATHAPADTQKFMATPQPLSPDVGEVQTPTTETKDVGGRLVSLTQPQAQAAPPAQPAQPVTRFSSRVNDAINQAAEKNGVDPQLLGTFAQIESSGRAGAQTGSYKGLFQLSDNEFAKHGGQGEIFDPYANADAAARKVASESAQFQQQYGRAPTALDLYMIHQQGAGGYAEHTANPDAPAWENMYATAEGQQKGQSWAKRAIWGNIPDDIKKQFPGGVDSVTSKDFFDLWQSKLEHFGAPTQTADAGLTTTDAGYSKGQQPPPLPGRFSVLSPRDRAEISEMAQKNIEQFHAANWETQKSQVQDDIKRIQDGGEPLPREDGRTSLDVAKEMAGDKRAKDAQGLQHEWNTALYSSKLKTPLSTMPYMDAVTYLARNKPDPRDPNIDYRAARDQYAEAEHQLEEINRMRTTDAAGSVDGFHIKRMNGDRGDVAPAPEVAAAKAQAYTGMVQQLDGTWVQGPPLTTSQKWGLMFKARLAAQEKAGLAPSEQRVLTRPEAERLMGMTSSEVHGYDANQDITSADTDSAVFARKMHEAADRAKAEFGPENAAIAMRSAVNMMVHDSKREKAASNAIAELATNGTLSPDTAHAIVNGGRIDPLADYLNRPNVYARADNTLVRPGVAASAEFGEQPIREAPRKDAIRDLQENPGTWRDFAEQFGAEATVRALTGGSPVGGANKSAEGDKPSFWQAPIGMKQLNEASPEDIARFNNYRTPAGHVNGPDQLTYGKAPFNPALPEPQPEPPTVHGGYKFGGNRFGGEQHGGEEWGGMRFGGKRFGASAKGLKTMESQ